MFVVHQLPFRWNTYPEYIKHFFFAILIISYTFNNIKLQNDVLNFADVAMRKRARKTNRRINIGRYHYCRYK